ncbi:uncharacterized protein ARMOST_07014 [Armillaria ostoyae]|uniref:Uncharacterized protein n=1 Tax=Armillaria ostoyae TaxID=47428 RepID=A0A284R4L5_ARMOS|nr:uncharacterized protein ARMOST_07014 [Armillaria ostoyae]
MNASNNPFADNTLLNIPTLRDLFTDQAFSDVIKCENSETVRTPVVAGSCSTSEEPLEDDRVDTFFRSLGLTLHPFTENAEENPTLRLSPMEDITDVPDPCDAIINPSLLLPGINMDPDACSSTPTSTDVTAVDETYSPTEEGTVTPNPLEEDSSTPVTESDSP